MVRIVFEGANGARRALDVAEGDTLMTAAVFGGVPGIEGHCGGAMACGTCHVHVPADWRTRLPEPGPTERELVAYLENSTAESRLGCQIVAMPELEGMHVSVVND
jgi:2Fe-2S ferredoxin